MSDTSQFQRLSKHVIPVHYDIHFKSSLPSPAFEGRVKINVIVDQPIKEIILHSVELDIRHVSLFGSRGKFVDFKEPNISYNTENEVAILKFESEINPGDYELEMSYHTKLSDNRKGFYRSTYKFNGKDHFMACTQFAPTDARRAFPCWDEPSFKATFSISHTSISSGKIETGTDIHNQRMVISNTPLSNSNQNQIAFKQTPKMSTYLVALVIGEFDFVEAQSNSVNIKVYTPMEKSEHGKFALDVAVKTLPFYEDYFKIAYPLPKLDLIAIPDFAFGAMENWGLVTYRENRLLIDPENSSTKAKMSTALTIGHELAHQWFGNLVTMEWWTHLWLNEGFASWIEYLCVDYCFPEFDIWTQFVTADLIHALNLDALRNSHPIEIPIGHPSEIDEIFDAISYCKGASIIRMLHNYIGDDAFRHGLRDYLLKFQYQNTVTEDLWSALEKASGKPVAQVMSTWTKQMGFPLLKVQLLHQEDDSITISISQSRFCADGRCGSGHWYIPICITNAENPEKPIFQTMIQSSTEKITLHSNPNIWINLNPGMTGVFRIHYDDALLELLVEGIEKGQLLPRDRLSILNDIFSLSKAGVISSVKFVNLLQAFKNEENFAVWNDITNSLSILARILSESNAESSLNAFCIDLYLPIYEKLGWNAQSNEDQLNVMLRSLVLSQLGSCGYPDVVSEALTRFSDHILEKAVISPDLRSVVYGTVLKHGDKKVYEQMINLYKASDMQEEQVRMLGVLGRSKDNIETTLNFMLTDCVRGQDAVTLLNGCLDSKSGCVKAWQFFKGHFQKISEKCSGGTLQARLVQCLVESFSSVDKAKEIETFFDQHPLPSAKRSLQQALETVHIQTKWIERDFKSLNNFFASHS